MITEKEPFNDVKVRQAINYAINRENLVQVCYDGRGRSELQHLLQRPFRLL